MSKTNRDSKPSKIVEEMAMMIAIVIRNAMEDFHCRHLSDEQMRELNPIIRNAVLTALHAMNRVNASPGARAFVDFHRRCIPKYWEPPVLLDDFLATESSLERTSSSPSGRKRE